MFTQVNSSFNRLTSAAFVAQAEHIVTAMTGNSNFPEPWSATVPTLAQIQTDLASFQSCVDATTAGDKTRIVARDAARQTLATDLTLLALYVQATAKGDGPQLATTGFPLRQVNTRTRTPTLPTAPENLKLTRGTVSGTAVASASRVPAAGSYDVQIATADPTVESNWTAVGSYKNCRRIELTGLTPGKVYSVRMRALGAAGPGAWTTAVSLMVA